MVAAGESLADLAGRYAVSIETLQRANNLASDAVVAGTVLEIPTTSGT